MRPKDTIARRCVVALDRVLDARVGADANPLRQLGAVGFFLFWTVAASGSIVYVFFDTSVAGAHASLRSLHQDQAWFGGLARSIHRYASDALIAVSVLHLLREWALGRFRAFRWFTWVSGLSLVVLALVSGLVGYWLVWDDAAAWMAAALLEWLVWLPGLGAALTRNAVAQANVTDRLFSLLLFLHIGVSLLLLLGMWVHIQRLTTPRTAPGRTTGAWMLATLAVLGIAWPAPLGAIADLARVGASLRIDWFYLALLPAGQAAPGLTWAVLGAVSALLCALPWSGRLPRLPAAVVDPANCNGCSRCFDDCPYGAIVMRAHVERRRHHAMAEVRAGDCAACGICAGSCPSATPFRGTERLASGIDIPSLPVDAIRERLREALLALPVSGGVLVFACECAAAPLAVEGAKSVMLSCAGQLPPAFVEYALRQGAGTVVVNACPPGDCEYRFGAIFCADRLERRREPSLRMGVERGQVVLSSHGRGHEDRLRARIATLRIRARLAGLAAHAEPPDDGVRGNG